MIKRKGWLLRKFTNPNRSITLWPHIYMGDTYWEHKDTHPGHYDPLIAHECVHLNRQRGRLSSIVWFIKWYFVKSFRLQEEALAMSVELNELKKQSLGEMLTRFNQLCNELAGPEYRHCASSPQEAKYAIERYSVWL